MKRVLIKHAAQIVTPQGNRALHGKEMCEVNIIRDGAIYIEDGVICKIGTTEAVNKTISRLGDIEVIDASGKAIIPGFVDSHTHFIFGGYRPGEFIKRLEGATYMEIMKHGGGIANTVKATRNTSKGEMISVGLDRLQDCLEQGVTTMEGKSGYGLDFDCEIKQLEAMKELDKEHPIELITTYLGAHDIPLEYKHNVQAYMEYMAGEVLPYIKRNDLATFVDIFCEESVYNRKQAETILTDAKKLGFDVKMHADEIISLGGAELGVELGAISTDHLLAASQKGIQALAASHTVATILPCTAFCLNKPYANARAMIDAGCAVALASDYNPGSCFTNSIPLILALGSIQMNMKIEEVLTALTLNGAAAIGLAGKTGSLEVGKQADLVMLQYPDYQFLVYHTGKNIVDTVMKRGEVVFQKYKQSKR